MALITESAHKEPYSWRKIEEKVIIDEDNISLAMHEVTKI